MPCLLPKLRVLELKNSPKTLHSISYTHKQKRWILQVLHKKFQILSVFFNRFLFWWNYLHPRVKTFHYKKTVWKSAGKCGQKRRVKITQCFTNETKSWGILTILDDTHYWINTGAVYCWEILILLHLGQITQNKFLGPNNR